MKRRPSEQTKAIVEIIEDHVGQLFQGDPTMLLDDVIVEFRKRMGGRLEESRRRVMASLPGALRILHEAGMFSTRVTEHYWAHRDSWPHRHPETQKDIVRSVAASSGGSGTYALHFCPDDDCVLFMQAFDHNARSGERKVAATVEKMRDMAEYGLLSPDGIAAVATNAGLQPRKDVRSVVRLVGRIRQEHGQGLARASEWRESA